MNNCNEKSSTGLHLVETPILNTLRSPLDLHNMSMEELNKLASEIRSVLCKVSEQRSIHFASNMGVVELTVALHSIFDFTQDRLVFDVGHQCYPHKILTGRFERIESIRTRNGLSGYPNPFESSYDLFMTGHAGSSIGSVLGLSCGDSLRKALGKKYSEYKGDLKEKGSKEQSYIAVVGDGAFTSGSIFEALNHAGGLRQKLLVVLNDNKMSICKRVGGLGRYLDHIRMAPGYLGAKLRLRQIIEKLPCAYSCLTHIKDAIKAGLVGGALFEDFGFRYIGPIDGHNLPLLRKYLTAIKNINEPVLLHILTEKGRGFLPAEIDPCHFHSSSPTRILASKRKYNEERVRSKISNRIRNLNSNRIRAIIGSQCSYDSSEETECTRIESDGTNKPFTYWAQKSIAEAMQKNPLVCVIVAAMAQGNMLEEIRNRFPDRFFDVGICEAHAVNFAAGLAKAGMKPIVDIYSGFLQRAYDQLFQETSLQDLPIVFSLDRSGLVGADGATHHGVFDLSYLRPFPNFEIIAPGDSLDMEAAFDYALKAAHPVAIRYPKANAETVERSTTAFVRGKAEIIRYGRDATIVACGGSAFNLALKASDSFAQGNDSIPKLDIGVINARFVKPLDVQTVLKPLREKQALIVVEENALIGGFGSSILEAANEEGVDARAIVRCGIPDKYIDHGTREEELRDAGLNFDSIVNAVIKAHNRLSCL